MSAVPPEDLGITEPCPQAADQSTVHWRGWLSKPVLEPPALLAAEDQAVFSERRQVPRDGRLGQFQGLMQVVDAHLIASAEQVQEP